MISHLLIFLFFIGVVIGVILIAAYFILDYLKYHKENKNTDLKQ